MVRTRRKPLEETSPSPVVTRNSAKRTVKVRRKEDVENVAPNRRTRGGGPVAASTPMRLTRENVKKLTTIMAPPAPVPDDEVISLSDCSDATLKAIRRQKFFSAEHHGKAETLVRTAVKRVQMDVKKVKQRQGKKKEAKPQVEPRGDDDDKSPDIYCFDESQREEQPPEPVIQKLLDKQKEAKKKARKPRKKIQQPEEVVERQPDKVEAIMNKIKEKIRKKQQLVIEEEDDDHFVDAVPEHDVQPEIIKPKKIQTESTKVPERRQKPQVIISHDPRPSTSKAPSKVDAVMRRIIDNVKKKQQNSLSDNSGPIQPTISSTPRAENSFQSFIDVANDTPRVYASKKSPRIQSSTPRNSSSPHPSKSPWRIQEENRVPHTKYFSFAKDLLPSYSSDSLIVDEKLPYVPSPGGGGQTSRSLNNSDMENISPAENPTMTPAVPQGARIPLRPLRRIIEPSPLVRHSVNRIQVLANVPVQTGFKVVNNALVRDVSFEENFHGFEDGDTSNYFGFDDAADDDTSTVEPVQPEDLRTKLTDLKHLAVDKLGRDETGDNNVPNLFLSPAKRHQNNLIEMFQKTTDKSAEKTTESEFRPSEVAAEEQTEQQTDLFDLFDDPEKMFVTQAEELRRKSYSRPARQRKRVHYSDYETDNSVSDEEEEAKAKAKKKKAKTKTTETTEEFKQFVSEFNSMCEEVENFDGFVIEKVSSATTTA